MQAARAYKKPEVNSTKKDVMSTRKFISEITRKKGIIPEDLRMKINQLLIKSQNKHGQDYDTVSYC